MPLVRAGKRHLRGLPARLLAPAARSARCCSRDDARSAALASCPDAVLPTRSSAASRATPSGSRDISHAARVRRSASSPSGSTRGSARRRRDATACRSSASGPTASARRPANGDAAAAGRRWLVRAARRRTTSSAASTIAATGVAARRRARHHAASGRASGADDRRAVGRQRRSGWLAAHRSARVARDGCQGPIRAHLSPRRRVRLHLARDRAARRWPAASRASASTTCRTRST